MYLYVIRVSFVCTRMSPVCHSYVALPWTLKDDSESISDLNIDLQFNRLTCETNDSIKQISGENNRVIYDSNKMNDNNNDNNSSEQRNDADTDFAIIQMKELIGNVKNLQTTYQDVFNISDTLQSKDTENKCDNAVPAWKKGTTLIVGDSILSYHSRWN